MSVTIHEDSTFLITNELGDIPEGAALGLYVEDTRFLSRYLLFLDGAPPVALSARSIAHCAAEYLVTNPDLASIPGNTLGIIRRRSVGLGMQDELEVTNYGDARVQFALDLYFGADFAHIFDVKRQPQVAGPAIQLEGRPLPTVEDDGRVQRFHWERGRLRRELLIRLSARPEAEPGRCRFSLDLAPRERWNLTIQFLVSTSPRQAKAAARVAPAPVPEPHESPARRRARLALRTPVLRTDSYVLSRAYRQSVRDYVALRLSARTEEGEYVIAAGIPWYLALFGRDSIIAAYQVLSFDPNVARAALRTLGRLQGRKHEPERGEEPGKILHEHRFGILAGTQREIPGFPYYGSIDATPLYLMLLAAYVRCTRDLELARELQDVASRALDWLDHWGDRDGDGYIEYLRAGEVGLENQGWKDSWDAVRFRDGSIARAPITLCEVQGYAYAARLGMAGVFEALGDGERAARLREAAAALKERFNRDFWLEDRGFYAQALDRDKRPVDSLTSNPGHLLWTGIAEPDRARLVAERLLSPEMFSGWGVRTMGSEEGGYNPLSYHNGSVWPHDNSLIAFGLARYGFLEEARRVVAGQLDALGHFPDYRLPELFTGYSRSEAPFPVLYPAACRPQAWASGAIFLLITAMLGLDLESPHDVLDGKPFLPRGIRRIALDRLWLSGRQLAIEVVRTESGEISRRIEV